MFTVSTMERHSGAPDTAQQEPDTPHPPDGHDPHVVAGIVDVAAGRAVVRTSGYLPGPDDVHVPPALVERYDLRRGDAVTGTARPAPDRGQDPRPDPDRRQPAGHQSADRQSADRQRGRRQPTRRPPDSRTLASVDTVNGAAAGSPTRRPAFEKFVPLHPEHRLLLETDPATARTGQLTGRVVDLVMPLGKGQRALIAAPPRTGKTMVLRAIADAVAANHPECHLMMVLVDERPEEVTDARRAIHGEVVASTFDRLPTEHVLVAELAVERAKRLVEAGRDVVLLLDSLTRLARAYNNAAASSGRILSGGIDAGALYQPKRLLGAARNVEGGGSLTIVATALVENGSLGDTVIFEELKSTGNAELKLDRRIAERRLFPAVDLAASGTRREELLITPEERVIVARLRRSLSALDPQAALEALIEPLRRSGSNVEFLLQAARRSPRTTRSTGT